MYMGYASRHSIYISFLQYARLHNYGYDLLYEEFDHVESANIT